MIIYNRSRIVYGILIITVILMGLCSRRYSEHLPGFVGIYAGDTLWALMVFLFAGFLFKRWPAIKIAIVSIVISFLIEISQLYHSPWIDMVRKTRLGGLVLGFGFLWSDLLCYLIGVLIGILIDRLLLFLKQFYIRS